MKVIMYTYSRKEIDNLLATLGFDVNEEGSLGPSEDCKVYSRKADLDIIAEDKSYPLSSDAAFAASGYKVTVYFGDILDAYKGAKKVVHNRNDDFVLINPWGNNDLHGVLSNAGCGTIEIEWLPTR